MAPSRLRWHLHPRARSSVRPKIRSVIGVMFVGLPSWRPDEGPVPDRGRAILGTVLYTEMIGRVAQD
ncbi:MAG: hypothetical protein ABSC87_02385 [Halobacteriota archaeon]